MIAIPVVYFIKISLFCLSVFLISEVVLVFLESFCAFLGNREQKVDGVHMDGWDGHHRSMVF